MKQTLPPREGIPRDAVGLGDLVRLIETFGESVAMQMAGLAGFRCTMPLVQAQMPQQTGKPEAKPEREETPEPAPEDVVDVYDVPHWVLQRRESIAPPEENQAASVASETETNDTGFHEAPDPDFVPPKPPATALSWQRSRGVLRRWFGGTRLSTALDEKRAVASVARQTPIAALPRRSRRDWPGQVMLVVDQGAHLEPYGDAMWHFSDQILRELGTAVVQRWVVDLQGDGVFYRTGPSGARHQPVPHQWQDGLVLVLGDLGRLREDQRGVTRWNALGRWLAKRGARTWALMPAQPRVIVAHDPWRTRVPDSSGRWRLPCLVAEETTHESKLEQGRLRLMALMSLAVRVEFPLLFALERLLPTEDWGLGLPSVVWSHPHTTGVPGHCWLEPHHRTAYQSLLTDESLFGATPDIPRNAAALIEAYHRGLNGFVRDEERFHHAVALVDGDGPTSWLWRLLHRVEEDGDLGVAQYILRLAARTFDDISFWQAHPTLPRLLAGARRLLPAAQSDPLPPGCEAAVSAMERLAPVAFTQWRVCHEQGALQLVPNPGTNGPRFKSPRSTISDLITAIPAMLTGQSTRLLKRVSLEEGNPIVLCDNRQDHWVLQNENFRFTYARMALPSFAVSMGEDADGLYVDLKPEHGERRLRWLPPNLYMQSSERPWHMGDGVWLDETLHARLSAPVFPVPTWAKRVDQDQYGIFAEFEVKGVVQRMRWILPGSFWMGATDEEDRWSDDKPRHKVWLTRPFWLADTACSQALWQAVMGENPSYHKDPEHPVEQVSFDDVGRFLERFHQIWPKGGWMLPTEAQWEYACRAGTTTAYSFGQTINTAQVNYSGKQRWSDEEAMYESRGETAPVKSFLCNDWGLYQMHGNVDEWCADDRRKYTADEHVDPTGALQGEKRVVRGGSTFDYAGLCRSADRSANRPGDAHFSLGFRLAAGP